MSDETPAEQPARRRRATTNKATVPAANAVPTTNSDWTKHPVLIVGGAVSATFLICLTYFNEFALPQRTARLEDRALIAEEKSDKLRADLASQNELIEDRQKEIARLESREKTLSKLLVEARTVDMFTPLTGYPNGFATVKIGMTEADVYATYPKEAIEVGELGYLSVTLANSPFGHATYYFEDTKGGKKISHIGFRLKRSYDGERQDLVKRISENLGKPLTIATGYHVWPALDKTDVLVTDKYSLIILAEGYRPAYWPEDKEHEALCKALAKNSCPINSAK